MSGHRVVKNRPCGRWESRPTTRSAVRAFRPAQTALPGPKTCGWQTSYATFGHYGAGPRLPHLRSLGKGANKTPLD